MGSDEQDARIILRFGVVSFNDESLLEKIGW
jgi:hypothetical protein